MQNSRVGDGTLPRRIWKHEDRKLSHQEIVIRVANITPAEHRSVLGAHCHTEVRKEREEVAR